ncbi:hypothetical protein [uncultured Phenylobacterium sp.]|uniref:hypothetical protein n=1 Tax=uncultured Phenylobacterium sp. TaxID=349273 RepID=UPI0025F94A9D|nr:hypothetical protein [uncultured Phenylobacterium sp.]
MPAIYERACERAAEAGADSTDDGVLVFLGLLHFTVHALLRAKRIKKADGPSIYGRARMVIVNDVAATGTFGNSVIEETQSAFVHAHREHGDSGWHKAYVADLEDNWSASQAELVRVMKLESES